MSGTIGRLGEEHWPDLCAALEALDDDDLIEQIVDIIEADGGFELASEPPPNHRRIEQSATTDKWYAIQNSELKFIKDATGWLAALAAFSVSKGIATAGSIIAFGLNYWRKRIELTPLQSLVLRALCRLPGKRGTVDEISTEAGLSTDRVVEGLETALTLRYRDNTRASIVEKDGDTWFALDL